MKTQTLPKSDEEFHVYHERSSNTQSSDLEWYDAARFGLFIHFGLYSQHAGIWEGEPVPGLGEWLMYRKRVPLAEYRKLIGQFRPDRFDADEICRLAAAAGMRYAVLTAKHHDGFALFHSKVSDFNIFTQGFGRDLVREFVEASRRHGLVPGLYYSQMIDWEDCDAVGPQGNDWDFDPARGDFERYFRRKALPQVTELLTNYGNLGVLWFDMPSGFPPSFASELRAVVRQLQPGVLVNSRIGGSDYDILSTDDNYVSFPRVSSAWEVPATMNGSWGFKQEETEWRPFLANLHSLLDGASKGGNLLLNIGPDGDGNIPKNSIEVLRDFASWIQGRQRSVHNTLRSPFPWGQPWGYITSTERALYLHVTEEIGGALYLPGLLSQVLKARLLGSSGSELLSFRVLDGWGVEIQLPPLSKPEVIELELAEVAIIDSVPPQWPDGVVRLDRNLASDTGDEEYEWTFRLYCPGRYKVVLISVESGSHHSTKWNGAGLAGTVSIGQETLPFNVVSDNSSYFPMLHFWRKVSTKAGEFTVLSTGIQNLKLSGFSINNSKWATNGLNLIGIELHPMMDRWDFNPITAYFDYVRYA